MRSIEVKTHASTIEPALKNNLIPISPCARALDKYLITVRARANVELARALAVYRGVPFDADMYRQRIAGSRDKGVLAGRWLGREGYTHKGSIPKDVARLALFLASDDAGSITGQDINVTGGSVMW